MRRTIAEGGESLPALRDLSVSLNKVGDIAQARGRLDAARAAYKESLALRRRTVAEGGESLQALDDLLHALTRNRELEVAVGNITTAESYNREIRPLLARLRLLAPHEGERERLARIEEQLNGVAS